MRYFISRHISENGEYAEGFSLHAVDEKLEQLFTYIQELRSWNRNLLVEDHFYFPELHEDEGEIAFKEITREEVYEWMPLVPRYDRRDEVQRRLSNQARAQIRKSGQVLTSAEIGLITRELGQKPAAAPLIKELIETRSQHKRWTQLMLYKEDGPARRQAISTLKANPRLKVNAKGELLKAKHRTKKITANGKTGRYVAVEVRYDRAAGHGLKAEEGETDR